MELISFEQGISKLITQFDSVNAYVNHIVRSNQNQSVSLVCIRLEAGGVLGRHHTVGNQLFLVVAGRGRVSGEDGVFVPIEAGQGAYWVAGELHEAHTDDGLTAIVIEGDDIAPAMISTHD